MEHQVQLGAGGNERRVVVAANCQEWTWRGGKWPVMRPKMNSSFTFRVEANEHKTSKSTEGQDGKIIFWERQIDDV